jgi:CheY-like chemotaxis protein
MRFPIDAVFLGRHREVVKLVADLPAWRASSARHARSVLELAAGEISARGIELGDRLDLVPAPLELANGNANGLRALQRDHHDYGLTDAGPLRVLLVGSDRRFRSVAAALLTQRGYSVAAGERAAESLKLAKLEHADVVVIDAGGHLQAAAREAMRLSGHNPPIGVVIVGEDADELAAAAQPGVTMISKWGSFERLYHAIEDTRPPRARDAVVNVGP